MPWQDQDILDALKDTYDLENEYKLEQEQINTKKFKDKLDIQRLKHIDHNLDQISRTRTSVIDNNPGVYEAYTAKYKTPYGPEQPPTQGTSPLAGLLRGAGDTAKFVTQHPVRAGAHANLGLHSLATLPFRLVESGIMGENKEAPFLSFKKDIREREEATRKADIEAGVNVEGAGPAVSEAVGGMVLPVGPTLRAGQHIKNILKGGAFAGGISAGEELAQKGDISAEQTGTATGVGGLLTGALSALFSRGKGRVPAPAPPPSETPKLLEGPPAPGEMRGGKVYGEAPPGGIAGEGKPVSSVTSGPPPPAPRGGPGPGAEAATPTRPPITHRPAEGEVPSATPETRSLTTILRPQPPADLGTGKEVKVGGTSFSSPEAAQQFGAAPKETVTPTLREKAIERTKEMSGQAKLLTPEEALRTAKEMDAAHEAAAKEATLKGVISGQVDVNKVPMKRGGKGKVPKSEAPAPAVEGEARGKVNPLTQPGAPSREELYGEPKIDFFGEGKPVTLPKPAVGKIAESKPIAEQPLKEVGGEKPKLVLQPKRTEDLIKEQGYKIREREPFPGEKEYDLIDPKSGNVVARGDRAQLTSALGNVPAAKGLKLYSFPGDLPEFSKYFKDSLQKVGAKVPEGVEVENSPHRAGIINTLLRPLETPEFNVRKSQAGRTITDAGREADRQINRRVKDLITEERVPGKEYVPTKLSGYFSAPKEVREQVNKVLVLGDKEEVSYTPEQLIRHGLTPEQVSMYQGVREALDKVVKWVKEIGPEYAEFDARKIEGYIPRVWKGDWEIYVNGNKYLKPKSETSSFSTLSEASAEAHGIKTKTPDAKVAIKFFPDPEYISSRGLQDARVIARVKANMERMGHMDTKTVDEAFQMGKSVKGFAKHLLERKDATGYETQDLDKVLNSYFYQAARRVEMQKVKNVAESVLKEHKADLSAGQVQYMQEYVERVAGKPAWDQIAIHQFVQDTPIGKWIDPVRGGKLIGSGRDLVTHLTLGFGNVGWALINLDGLTRHVWPLLAQQAKMMGSKSTFDAEKYMLHGIKQFFQNKGLRQQLAHHGIIDIQMMSEPTPKIGHTYGEGRWTPEKISMILGTATEEFSRGVAAIARYQMSLDRGMKPAQAMTDAARFVEQTLGRYTRGGRPPAYTGAIGSTVGLFKTYMSVMMQNGWRALESKDPGTIARYITGAVGVSGVLGLVPGIEDLDSALTKSTGWSPIETIEKNLPPAVSTGLFSLAGVDISRRAGIPEVIPNDARGWAGPVIGRFASTISDIANGEYGEAVLDMLPNSVRNVIGVVRGYKEGKVIGRMDKPSYSVTPKEAALHAVGLTPSNEAADSRLYQRNVNKEAYRESSLDKLTRKIASGTATDADYAKFSELGGKSKRIKNERVRQSETLVERQYKHLPKILRREQPVD